jgi:hypothetical protein
MFGFSAADWIFIVLVFFIVIICIGISDMYRKK